MTNKTMFALAAGLALMGLAAGAHAGTALETAIEAGAKRLSADQIAARLTGKTVTFVSARTGDRFLVYYGTGNDAVLKKVGGAATLTGFYAVTDRDQVCLGWKKRDLPRLRCVDVLLIEGVLHKFRADGSLDGRIVALADGNTT